MEKEGQLRGQDQVEGRGRAEDSDWELLPGAAWVLVKDHFLPPRSVTSVTCPAGSDHC